MDKQDPSERRTGGEWRHLLHIRAGFLTSSAPDFFLSGWPCVLASVSSLSSSFPLGIFIMAFPLVFCDSIVDECLE